MADGLADEVTAFKDGKTWQLGSQSEVDWIAAATAGVGLTIATAVPPIFADYATVVIPAEDTRAHDRAVLELLTAQSPDQPWWLGYLDTGGSDIVFPAAAKVGLYTGWTYVLVQAGPAQAGAWRTGMNMHGALPEIIFPVDHTWLVSRLWDDDWRCAGAPVELIHALCASDRLAARRVSLDQDAAPPGHTAY